MAALLTAGLLAVGCTGGDPGPPVDPAWPSLFGPHQNSVADESLDPRLLPDAGPPEKYRVPIGRGYSSPIAVDGKVIVQHRLEDEELISAFDLETGEGLWEIRYPTTYECRFEYTDGPYGTPLAQAGRVYALGAQWQAYCLNLADGSVVWRRNLADEFAVEEGLFGFGPGMVIENGKLIFNLGAEDGGVVALDADSGATVWASGRDRSSYTMPRLATIHGRRYVMVLTFEGLQALDPETGEQYWFVPFTNRTPLSVAATSPLVVGDKVLLVTGPGPGAVCLRVTPDGKSERVWEDRRTLDSQWNTLMEVDGVVYGYTAKRIQTEFRAVNLDDGQVRWSWPTPLDRGSGLIAGETFILWGEHGHLAFMAVDAAKPRVHWLSGVPLLKTPTYAAPALHRGLLLVRDEDTLLCLSLRAEDLKAAAEGPQVPR